MPKKFKKPVIRILKDITVPLTIAELYGDALDKMEIGTDSIIIQPAERAAVINYARRRYGGSRSFTTRTVNGQLRVFRGELKDKTAKVA